MTKQLRLVFYGLIALVAILAGSTTFFASKSRMLEREASKDKTTAGQSVSSSSTELPKQDSSPKIETTSEITKPTSASERPSRPAKTYTIEQHETLFSIIQKQETTLTEISEANGITDADKILFGQILLVPENDQVNYIIDNTKASDLQKLADSGKVQFRLSPEETSRADSPLAYGLKVTDSFTLQDKDNQGKATISATNSEGKKLIIKLIQPVTKSDKGIWAIESISPV